MSAAVNVFVRVKCGVLPESHKKGRSLTVTGSMHAVAPDAAFANFPTGHSRPDEKKSLVSQCIK